MSYDLSNDFDKNRAITKFKKMLEEGKRIILKKVLIKRSIKQNAYMHICFDMFAVHFGLTSEESKTLLKRECPFMRYSKKISGRHHHFLTRTSDLTEDEAREFIEWIMEYSGKQGCYIMSSDEYLTNQHQINEEIEQSRKHL